VVKIDNQHDPFATVVTIEYGDRLGELLDTVRPTAAAQHPHVLGALHNLTSHALPAAAVATVRSHRRRRLQYAPSVWAAPVC
jgi:hypothetical protein